MKRVTAKIDRRFFRSLLIGLVIVLGVAATLVWLFETDRTPADLGKSIFWAGATVLGQGGPGFVSGPVGWGVGWLLGLFGVAIVATITGTMVGFAIDFLLKEGQGMGASGYRDHIVVCGWNATARDLIEELGSDEYDIQVVLLCDLERSPARDGVYFVRGQTSESADLIRAGIEHAQSAIICPADGSDEADLRSILTILAIETIAPGVRTVAEVNNPGNVPHFKRANADEILVTSRLASHLLARSAMYPGLSELVTDIVSGGEGSELYRIDAPDELTGRPIDEVARRLREDHHATLLGVSRNGRVLANPKPDFEIARGDDLVVLAESLGSLAPMRPTEPTEDDRIEMQREFS